MCRVATDAPGSLGHKAHLISLYLVCTAKMRVPHAVAERNSCCIPVGSAAFPRGWSEPGAAQVSSWPGTLTKVHGAGWVGHGWGLAEVRGAGWVGRGWGLAEVCGAGWVGRAAPAPAGVP